MQRRSRVHLTTFVPPDPPSTSTCLPPTVCRQCFPGKFWRHYLLAGPQRHNLESRRGCSEANWPDPSESWHHGKTQATGKLKSGPQYKALLPSPPHLVAKKVNHSLASLHAAISETSRWAGISLLVDIHSYIRKGKSVTHQFPLHAQQYKALIFSGF